MKALLTRFGGIGDTFPVMVAAKELNKRGYEVTVALRDDGGPVKQSVLYSNYQEFRFLDFTENGPWGNRCIDTELGRISIQSVYNDYDLVVDYMNCVENNSTSPYLKPGPNSNWQKSRSSNFVNWYDLHLSWANINPALISDEDKRPFLKLTEAEQLKAEEFSKKYSQIFVIHPYASSLARSWYQAKGLINKLLERYKDSAVVFWNPEANCWDLISRQSIGKLENLAGNPLRSTMVLLAASTLLIGVDTGCSHMAEALGKKSLVIYSTVPAWTRNKYYKYQTHIDPGEKDGSLYTFSLGLGDPLRIVDGVNALTDREKLIKQLWERNASPEEAQNALNTDYRGAELELQMFMAKQETWERQQSKALSSVSVDLVFQRIRRIIE